MGPSLDHAVALASQLVAMMFVVVAQCCRIFWHRPTVAMEELQHWHHDDVVRAPSCVRLQLIEYYLVLEVQLVQLVFHKEQVCTCG